MRILPLGRFRVQRALCDATIAPCRARICVAIADLSRGTSRLRVRKTLVPKITVPAATTRLMANERPLAMTDHTGTRLIPKEKDSVVYCTCPNDKTSRVISRRALAMHFLRVKFLKGGLAGWKAKGYPVERYEKPFQLDTRT